MPVLTEFKKQPADVQDYDIDFTAYVTGMGEAVTDSHEIDVVTVDTGLTLGSSEMHNGTTLDGVPSCFIKVWLSGGTSGSTYKVTARIATDGGRVHEVEIKIKVKED